MSAANRNRGARAEVQVVNWLRAEGWPDARRYLAGDGRQPGDIDWHPLICLEVKDRAKSCWPTWCRQVQGEARSGQIPAVVRRTRGVPDVGRWEVRVEAGGWLELAEGQIVVADDLVTVDGTTWVRTTMAALASAVRAVDL